jgi:O-antigen ligase
MTWNNRINSVELVSSSEPSAPTQPGWPTPTRLSLFATASWTTGGTVLYLLAPSIAPIVLPLCLISPLAWYWHTHGNFYVMDLVPVGIALAIAAGYAFVNALWSPAQVEAFQFAAMLLVVAICVPIATRTLLRTSHAGAIHAMAMGFYVGFAAAGAFLFFEILTQAAVHVRLMAVFPALWPNSWRHLGSGGQLPDHFLNHKMVGLVVLFWPAVLATMYLISGRARRGLLLCGLLPPAIAIAASEHQTSQVALIVSGIGFVAFRALPRVALKVFVGSWVAACLAVVPICLAAYAANLHNVRWLQASAQHRIVIWKATSDRVFDAPLLGSGIHSSREFSKREPATLFAPGTQYRLSVSWHSHNAFLQVWSEAGAVGAAILFIFGLLVMRSIRRTLLPAQAALFATFSACAMIAATGYSGFAPWLSASFALAAIFASLGVAAMAARTSAWRANDMHPVATPIWP